MALDPTPTETIAWATTEGTSGPNTGIPDTAAQQHGWPAAPATPVRTWFNYWMRGVWIWIQWLVGAIPRKASFTAAEWAALPGQLPVGIYFVRPSGSNTFNSIYVITSTGLPAGSTVGFGIKSSNTTELLLRIVTVHFNGTTYEERTQAPITVATTAEAQAGSSPYVSMTPEKTRQAVAYNGLRSSGSSAQTNGWTETGAGSNKIVLTEWGFSTAAPGSGTIQITPRAVSVYGATLIPIIVSPWSSTDRYVASSNGTLGGSSNVTIVTTGLDGNPFLGAAVYWSYTMILTLP